MNLKGERIHPPDDLINYVLDHGRTVNGMTPERLVEVTEWYVMDRIQEQFYELFYRGQIWGGVFSKNCIEVDKDYVDRLFNNPYEWADEAWHEYTHNSQYHKDGSALFKSSYATQFIFKAGWWGKRWKRVISYERQAFAEQAAFRMRITGRV